MIRPFELQDLFAMKQLQSRGMAFDLRRLLLGAFSPTWAALLGHLTRQHLGAFTLVQTDAEDGRAVGYIEAWPRSSPQEWELAYLAPSLDYQRDAQQVWQELLSQLIIVAGQRHIQRIYAKVPEDAEIEAIFRAAGFTVVTREQVFVLIRQPAPAPLPRGMRRVEPHDRWPLEQLYCQVVPPLLFQAEGGLPYEAPQGGWWRRGATQEYIWADRERALAYLALNSGPRGYWLRVVVRPENRGDLLPCIRYLLAQAQCSDATPVYVPVPDFTVGLGWLLRTLGFESYNRQTLLVAHIVVRSAVNRPLLISGGVGARTSVGRVSTRLHDGCA